MMQLSSDSYPFNFFILVQTVHLVYNTQYTQLTLKLIDSNNKKVAESFRIIVEVTESTVAIYIQHSRIL